MAREQATSTISPFRFVLGAPVFAEDYLEVIKQANWSFGHRPQVHLSQTTAVQGWQDAESPHTHGISFRATGAAYEVFRFRVRLLPETVNVTCGASCSFAAGGAGVEDGDVTFSFRDDSDTLLDSVTLSFEAGDNGTELTGTVQTSSTGSGWVTVTIEIEKQTGAGAAELYQIRVQDEAITSGLPAPSLLGDNDTIEVRDEGVAL